MAEAEKQDTGALLAEIAELRAQLAAKGNDELIVEPVMEDEVTIELIPPRKTYATRVAGEKTLKRYDRGQTYGVPERRAKLLLAKRDSYGKKILRVATLPPVDPKEGLKTRAAEFLDKLASRGEGFLDKLETALTLVMASEANAQPDGDAPKGDEDPAAEPKPKVGAEPKPVKTRKKKPAKAKPKKKK